MLLAGSLYTQEAPIITLNEEPVAANKSMTVDFETIVKNILYYGGTHENTHTQKKTQQPPRPPRILNLSFQGYLGLTSNKTKNASTTTTTADNDNKHDKNARVAVINEAFTAPSMLLGACRIINAHETSKLTSSSIYPAMRSFKLWHRNLHVNEVIVASTTSDVWQCFMKNR